MDIGTILMWCGIAAAIYFLLTLVEKILLKRKAAKVMKYDTRTSSTDAGNDNNE